MTPPIAPHSQPSRKPDLRFLLAHPTHFLALGFGSGLAPFAPGTFGTLAGWALYPFIRPGFTLAQFFFFLLAGFLVGSWACARTGRDLGQTDPGAIVWDEILAIWLVLAFLPATWPWQLAGFVGFRFFDIVKPPPVRWADQRWKNGVGVMADDVFAAAYTLLVLWPIAYGLRS